LARSRTGSRAGGPRPAAAPGLTLASATVPRVWQGIGYRPLPDTALARPLFDYAAVPWPTSALEFAWGAATAEGGGERLVGAVVGERSGTAALLHGPVVVTEREPLEIATQLVGAVIDHAGAAGVATIFARPLSLDRVWVRFGFIPLPESTLPPGLAGRPGVGLYAWRGGSALWTMRDAPRE
jgi:hypothetical protein